MPCRYTGFTRAEDRAPQGCDLSADASADWRDDYGRPAPASVCQKALNPGVAGATPPIVNFTIDKRWGVPPGAIAAETRRCETPQAQA